jgi:hypothetical protein
MVKRFIPAIALLLPLGCDTGATNSDPNRQDELEECEVDQADDYLEPDFNDDAPIPIAFDTINATEGGWCECACMQTPPDQGSPDPGDPGAQWGEVAPRAAGGNAESVGKRQAAYGGYLGAAVALKVYNNTFEPLEIEVTGQVSSTYDDIVYDLNKTTNINNRRSAHWIYLSTYWWTYSHELDLEINFQGGLIIKGRKTGRLYFPFGIPELKVDSSGAFTYYYYEIRVMPAQQQGGGWLGGLR